MAEKILVEHLVKKYGDNTVLNDINVSMYPSTKEMSSVSLALQVQEKVHSCVA